MLTLFTAGPRITTVPRHCGGSECGKWSSGAADCADCANLGILISGQHLADVRCLVSEYSVSRSPHSLQILCSCLQSDRCLLSLHQHQQPPPPAVSGSPTGSHKHLVRVRREYHGNIVFNDQDELTGHCAVSRCRFT